MTKATKATRPMRVVIGCDTFPPDINGASRFAERLASGLVRAGHEVHVIAPSYSKRYGTFTEVHDSSSMTVHRLKSYRVVQHKTLRYVWPFTLKAKTDRILRELKPDAVHINSHMIVGRYLLRSARQQGIRVVATNHIMPENLIKYSLVIPRWAEKIAMNLAWKDAGRVLRKADVVTTPTRKAANLLESASGLSGVLAVSCGIEASKFANNTPTTNTEPRILYLGRLDYEKHIHNLLKAVAMLPKKLKVKLEIVGDGGEREYLEGLAKDLGIAKNVEFRGHISDEELPKVYERATVFAMPSIAELQSIATMEAMASGRPVVAADAMALPHLVHDGDNGYLFPPDDVKAFADRLLKILTADQKELDRLSENSLHLIQSHDIDRTIGIFESLYRGDEQEQRETADNLDTYSLPIGNLSKTLSRSIALARKRSAQLRARAERARSELLVRAESAGDEVKGRFEEVRDEVSFAAQRLELRIRGGVRKAANRLRLEDIERAESRQSLKEGQLKPVSKSDFSGAASQTHKQKSKVREPWTLKSTHGALTWLKTQIIRTLNAIKTFMVSAASAIEKILKGSLATISKFGKLIRDRSSRLKIEGTRRKVIRLKARQSSLPKRIYLASSRLAELTSAPDQAGTSKARPNVKAPVKLRGKLGYGVADEVLITAGVLMSLFVVWFLFLNDPIQGASQEESARTLVQEWRDESGIPVTDKAAAVPSTELPPVVVPPNENTSFATLYVPRFGMDFVRVIAEGTDEATVLNSRTRGVGRYTNSDPLGAVGNFAIAGHRTSWGAAFGQIGDLRLGDKIFVEIPEGWFEYSFRNTEYVWETEVDVLNPIPKSSESPTESRIITLTSCHPKFSEAERIIAYGVFEGWYPRDAGAPGELIEILKSSQ